MLHTLTLFIRQAVEQVIADYILPLPVASSSKDKSAIVEIDEVRWTDRLLNTIKYLEDDKALNALLVCTNLKLGYGISFEMT